MKRDEFIALLDRQLDAIYWARDREAAVAGARLAILEAWDNLDRQRDDALREHHLASAAFAESIEDASHRRDELVAENEKLKAEIQSLQAENAKLKADAPGCSCTVPRATQAEWDAHEHEGLGCVRAGCPFYSQRCWCFPE